MPKQVVNESVSSTLVYNKRRILFDSAGKRENLYTKWKYITDFHYQIDTVSFTTLSPLK